MTGAARSRTIFGNACATDGGTAVHRSWGVSRMKFVFFCCPPIFLVRIYVAVKSCALSGACDNLSLGAGLHTKG